MSLNIGDYRVIAISSPSGVEKNLSSAFDQMDAYDMICVSIDSTSKNETAEDAIFVLINPENITDTIINELKGICLTKKVIFYLHNRDIAESSNNIVNLKAIVNKVTDSASEVIDKIKFSHEPTNNNEFKPYKTFLECVKYKVNSGNDFTECLKKLIEESLKIKNTPHLIALSILCQGYLAVKDPDKIKFTNKIDLRSKDIPADWWNPAFGSGDVFNNTGVSKEIKALGKEVPAGITNLFNKKKEPPADFVYTAYASLPDILKT